VEPPHTYLRSTSAPVVHHADYLDHRADHALCGAHLESPVTLLHLGADPVCPECESRLVHYHLQWWREQALTATAELEKLRAKYGEAPAPGPAEPAHDEPEPTTLLGRAQRELTDLCRQFEGAIPFYRLKSAMQAFSDGLGSDERVLLAEEIGAHGSLIRWSTAELEARGHQVSNSPVQEEVATMWETWHHDSYAAPKKSKKRFGRR